MEKVYRVKTHDRHDGRKAESGFADKGMGVMHMDADERAEELFERYADMVYRIAVSYGGSGHWAEDVVQDVFVRFLRRQPVFESGEHEKAWFIRVAVNCSKSILSGAWMKRKRPLEECGEQEEPLLSEERGDEVFEALSKLPSKYRIVLYLRYYEEYQVKEIAELLHITQNLVSVRLKRAKAMMKTSLSGEREEMSDGRDRLSKCVSSDLSE